MKTLILTLALFSICGLSFASGNHHESNQTIINISQPSVHRIEIDESNTAMLISASRCDFGDAGRSLQICVGLGQYKDNIGGTVGIGMVINDTLWNGSISGENGEAAIGLGWTWHVR